MKCDKKYYKKLDIIRVLACIAVLLYHLNLLKGGYLAVCTFFVLSGYLSCISAFRKKHFSLKEYYSKRLLHIYMPLLAVVFITVFLVTIIPSINWVNLKPETTSVILGFNNFWQLSANLDYFARHVNSPFMHLWYIAILLQFDLVFPFIFLTFQKLGNKKHKLRPCVIASILAVGAAVYFYIMTMSQDIMVVYYNTFMRIFSLLFGVSLAFIRNYYGALVPRTMMKKSHITMMFYGYLLLMTIMFWVVDANSTFFPLAMILTTIITCRLIEYGTIVVDLDHKADSIIKFISNISYEIYLVQYPVIFFMQYVTINKCLKIFLIIIVTLLLAYILHVGTSINKSKASISKRTLQIIIFILSVVGLYEYIVAKDYTAEMKALEAQLNQNQQMMEEKQAEYAKRLEQEQNEWNSMLDNLENEEGKLKEAVANMAIVGVGDSVMLGAVNKLYQQFPNGYFDAKISRTAWVANGILKDLNKKKLLGETVVINLGANGDCPESCKKEIMKTCKDRKVFWLNTTNDSVINENLEKFASKYDNLYVIQWDLIAKDHPEYFRADGIHLTESGIDAYAEVIYNSIYQAYLDDYNKKKDEIFKEHENAQKSKISFYGNDVLLNSFDYLHNEFPVANFVINDDFDFKTLKDELIEAKNAETLNHRIVLAFDETTRLTNEEYWDLIQLCDSHEIYIISMNKQPISLNAKNVKVINVYPEIDNYFMADGVHLTEKGNEIFSHIIITTFLDNK